jgi:hypothetical protein
VAQYRFVISANQGKRGAGSAEILRQLGRSPRTLFYTALLAIVAVALYLTPVIKVSGSTTAVFSKGGPAAQYYFHSGTTVGGYPCGPGKRQIPWSHYSPWCEPAFHGNNGGATAPGVTGKEIVITYREAASQDLNLAYVLVPRDIIGDNTKAEQTMQAYINIFNKVFELYGRHVVLKPFKGKSDFIQENLGGAVQAVQSDALTVAHEVHAFADLSLIDSSPIYDTYLSENHVINFNLGFLPKSFYEQHAPYSYSPGPDCDKTAEGDAAMIGKYLAGKPAIYAGDPALQRQTRVFGLIVPAGGPSVECTDRLIHLLTDVYHVSVPVIFHYAFNLQTINADISAMITQMQQNHVTTVVCAACDPASPTLTLSYAEKVGYFPEWISEAAGAGGGGIDGFAQNLIKNAPQEAPHTLLAAQATAPKENSEAWYAYNLGATPEERANLEPLYPIVYEHLFLFFSALQAAGPYLTPQTFEAGFQSLPDSTPGGQFGNWHFGPGVFDPASSFQETYLDPNSISLVNGKPGAWVPCNDGEQFSYSSNPASVPPSRFQLRCFGK